MNQVAEAVLERARSVRLLVLDVDGVLTDGGLYYGPAGEEIKRFHVQDGLGVKLLREAGIRILVISAKASAALERRLEDLGIEDRCLGCRDKLGALERFLGKEGVDPQEVCFVGDDLLDLPAMRRAGLPISVPNAHPVVQAIALQITERMGGNGAVREVCDLLLQALGRFDSILHRYQGETEAVRSSGFGVIIPARYAASRLPGKPLRPLLGRPMVEHVYRNAMQTRADFVTIATDDARIEAAARRFTDRVAMTSPAHSNGTERAAEVVEQLQLADDFVVVNLQGDEPLLPAALIQMVADALAHHPAAGIATLATPIRSADEVWNPNAVKVVVDGKGMAQYFSRAPIPWVRDGFKPMERPRELPEGAPTFLRHIGLYAYRVGTLKRLARTAPPEQERAEMLEQLRALWLGIPIHVSVIADAPPPGVDSEEDLERVEKALASHFGSGARREADNGI